LGNDAKGSAATNRISLHPTREPVNDVTRLLGGCKQGGVGGCEGGVGGCEGGGGGRGGGDGGGGAGGVGGGEGGGGDVSA
jgi:hypothetical protein